MVDHATPGLPSKGEARKKALTEFVGAMLQRGGSIDYVPLPAPLPTRARDIARHKPPSFNFYDKVQTSPIDEVDSDSLRRELRRKASSTHFPGCVFCARLGTRHSLPGSLPNTSLDQDAAETAMTCSDPPFEQTAAQTATPLMIAPELPVPPPTSTPTRQREEEALDFVGGESSIDSLIKAIRMGPSDENAA